MPKSSKPPASAASLLFGGPMRTPEDTDLLIDMKNFVARATLAKSYGPELTTKAGIATGPFLRAFRMLHSLRKRRPGRLVFCFEGGEQKRYDIHPGYKESRRVTPPIPGSEPGTSLVDQFLPHVTAMVQHMRCTFVTPRAAEADDAIYSWIKDHPERAHVVLSTDRDLWYLLKYPQVVVLNSEGDGVTPDKVRSTYHVPPSRIPLMKALFGDNSDCIPKVPRLGEADWKPLGVLAVKAKTLGGFMSLLADDKAAQIVGLDLKKRDRILAARSQVHRMLRVVKLRHVSYTASPRQGNLKKLTDFLQRMECTSLLPHAEFMTL